MKAGEFPPGTAFYFAQTPEQLYMIDGQHRLRSQVQAMIDIEFTITTIECPDENAVACLFTQFDIGAKRSMGDRMRALDVGHHINLPARYAQLVFNGAPHLKYRFGKITPQQVAQMNPQQRLEILREYETGQGNFSKSWTRLKNGSKKSFLSPISPLLVLICSSILQSMHGISGARWQSMIRVAWTTLDITCLTWHKTLSLRADPVLACGVLAQRPKRSSEARI